MNKPYAVAQWNRRITTFMRRQSAGRAGSAHWTRLPPLVQRSHWLAVVRSLESFDREET
jgi:hypothetical protein